MPKSSILHTGRASLCALGAYLRRRCFFAPLREQVTIPQEMVRYHPIDKVLDAFLDMLCGAKTIAQSNVTIHTAPAVQRAFGAHPVRRAIDACPHPARLYCHACGPTGAGVVVLPQALRGGPPASPRRTALVGG
jgi:hypothetical protein